MENIESIERFTAEMDLRGFAKADQTIRATKYSLLVISEAAMKLGDRAADLCPAIPWREIRGLGNRLRHDYQSIDVVRIWLLIERDLPPLKAACRDALHRLQEDDRA
ncbi:HepT-like ribonuclease domain-containing protein [Rhodopila sp.]|uniref:HepT-like ribonuclease domain-containing protein n=1 Tax=Rhodopila sp. TaxID=2480087 RepID=UPI003D11B5A8